MKTEFQRFVLIGQARSGTWLLTRALAQHPDVLAAGELFHYSSDVRRRMYADVLPESSSALEVHAINGELDGYFYDPVRRTRPTVQAAGFKLLYEHAGLDWARGDVAVERTSDLKVLHLVRANPFDVMCSWWIACLEQAWWNELTTRTIRIEPHTARTWLEARERRLSWTRNLDVTRPVLELDYDTFVRQPQAEIDRAFAFLGLEPHPLAPSTLARQDHRTLAEKIENFDELAAAFYGTKWEQYLCAEGRANGH